jgi:hypothetical protein
MKTVDIFDKYIDHILRLAKKKPSANRDKGIAWYTAAAECLSTFILQPKPAWVDVVITRKR